MKATLPFQFCFRAKMSVVKINCQTLTCISLAIFSKKEGWVVCIAIAFFNIPKRRQQSGVGIIKLTRMTPLVSSLTKCHYTML